MKPLVTRFVRMSQGSNDPTFLLALARYNWIKQLAICFGILDPTKFQDIPLPTSASGEVSTTENPTEHEANCVLSSMVEKLLISTLRYTI